MVRVETPCRARRSSAHDRASHITLARGDAHRRRLRSTEWHQRRTRRSRTSTTTSALPRLSGLVLSPDGIRLVTTVAERSPDGKRYSSSLWEVDPGGQRPARRLTRSAPGEAQPAFLPDGRLLFSSRRPDAEAKPDDDSEDRDGAVAAPGGRRGPAGGPPRRRRGRRWRWPATPATSSSRRPRCPARTTVEDDEQRRQARKDAGVTAILHEAHPVRYWDHDLGPDESHVLFAGPAPLGDGRLTAVRDLTPAPEGRVGEGLAVSPDGRTVAVGWRWTTRRRATAPRSRFIDTATGERRGSSSRPTGSVLRSGLLPGRAQPGLPAGGPSATGTPPRDRTLRLLDLGHRRGRDLLPRTRSLWPSAPVFSPDGDALYFVADEARPGAGLPARPRHRRGHPADRRRARTRTWSSARTAPPLLRAALGGRLAADAGPARPDAGRTRSRSPCSARQSGRAPARHAHRGHHHRRGRHAAARLAGAAGDGRRRRGRRRCCCGSTAAR